MRGPDPPPALPEGNSGIAARHPGDVGIGQDPAVIFHDDFEDSQTTADMARKWDVMYGREHISVSEDPANVNSGRRAVEMTIPKQDISLIDRFDIGLFIAKNSLRENTKWWDDIVAATSYIGPRVPAGAE